MYKLLFLIPVLFALFACQSPLDLPHQDPTEPTDGWTFRSSQYVNDEGCKPGYTNGKIRSDKTYLEWTTPSIPGFFATKLYRNDTLLKTFTSSETSYIDDGLYQNQQYQYRLVTIDDRGLGHADTLDIRTPQYNAPTWMNYGFLSSTQVRLFWPNSAENASHYSLYKYDYSNGFELFATVQDTFYVMTIEPNTNASFQISVDSNYESSTPVSGTFTLNFSYIMTPPTNLYARSINDQQVSVEWVDASTAETGYTIQRSTSMTNGWETVADVPANTVQYIDQGSFTVGQTYYYRVRAFNAIETTDWATTSVIFSENPQYTFELGNSPDPYSWYDSTYYSGWGGFTIDDYSHYISKITVSGTMSTDDGNGSLILYNSYMGYSITIMSPLTNGEFTIDNYELDGYTGYGSWILYLSDYGYNGGHQVTNARVTIEVASDGRVNR
jgi:hypothetical protein